MSFRSTVLNDPEVLDFGRVIKDKLNCILAYDLFQSGIQAGRFCFFNTISNDVRTGNPGTYSYVGVLVKKTTGEPASLNTIYKPVYTAGSGSQVDSVAEVCCFGYVVAEIPTAVTPVVGGPVYVDALGRATTDTAQMVVDAQFVERVTDVSWVVKLKTIFI